MTRIIAVALIALLCRPTLPGQDLAREIDRIMTKGLETTGVPGASLLVARGEKVLHERGYGFADLENDVPVTPSTVFRIGSITKQFTAAAIMKLREAGKLTVDDELAELVPGFGFAGKRVTVHQLLNHTSGIKSYTNLPNFSKVENRHLSHTELFALIKDQPFDFEPGDAMRYNNSGYYLLGVIQEKVAQKDYARFLKDEVFDPLGMTQSRYGGRDPIVKHRAKGYTMVDGKIQNCRRMSMRPPFAAGALLSTTRDLHRWTVALHGGKVLSKESYEMMTTPKGPAQRATGGGYGYGLVVGRVGERDSITHGGGINGFRSVLMYFPKEKVTIVLLYNLDRASPSPLASQVAEVVMGGR